ncbi:MAG TPA: COX15/CtaA family protein [Verrucomicrobiae bacterium]|nr:COX15/CtaA family protein [Verrucomicrobiae bacterium]
MARTTNNPWLGRYAAFTALATLALICAGGLVTSHGAGMAVPDWPNTFGYNMFFFRISQWVGGVFYEHTHRLIASGVGLLTTILAVWLWLKESRRWLRWLGVIAFLAVVFQGVLGGLRVVLFKDEIGIFHATLAQLFFCLVCAIALFLSRWWRSLDAMRTQLTDRNGLRRIFLAGTVLIFAQLILGATMRHQHAGLAIPDFPTAYGKLWPEMDVDSVAKYNQDRIEIKAFNPITAFQIGLQMTHRLGAVLIFAAVAGCAWLANRQFGVRHPLGKLCSLWFGLIVIQVFLGAATIWTGKSADIATAHVAVGALSLSIGVLATIVARRVLVPLSAQVSALCRTSGGSTPFEATPATGL